MRSEPDIFAYVAFEFVMQFCLDPFFLGVVNDLETHDSLSVSFIEFEFGSGEHIVQAWF